MEWVKVYESHNEYEWRMQIALCQVEPWGDDRDDMRAAVNTSRIVASHASEPLDESQLTKLIHDTRTYLKIHHPDEDD